MADATINVTPYDGGLLELQLLSSAQTIVLGDFGTPTSGTLTDDDGLLSDADDGIATFNGFPINYIGSGTATPGVDVLGITVPLGTPVDLVVFEAGGQIYFHYPDGEPSEVGMIAVVIDIDSSPYQVFTPVCFAKGTLIATPDGEVPVETLRPGDFVRDIDGRAHEVLWCKGRALEIPDRHPYEKWLPVRIAANAFGPGRPHHDTLLSQQHRVLMEGPWVELVTGEPSGFSAAVQLVNDRSIRLAREQRKVTYYHILCAEHVVLLANGLPAESLLLRTDGDRSLDRRSFGEALELFPELAGRMECAAPVMTGFEARAVSRRPSALAAFA